MRAAKTAGKALEHRPCWVALQLGAVVRKSLPSNSDELAFKNEVVPKKAT